MSIGIECFFLMEIRKEDNRWIIENDYLKLLVHADRFWTDILDKQTDIVWTHDLWRNLAGELSIIDGKPRSATVIAETPVSLLVIRRQDFRGLRETVPGLEEKLLLTLCDRLRQADQALGY